MPVARFAGHHRVPGGLFGKLLTECDGCDAIRVGSNGYSPRLDFAAANPGIPPPGADRMTSTAIQPQIARRLFIVQE